MRRFNTFKTRTLDTAGAGTMRFAQMNTHAQRRQNRRRRVRRRQKHQSCQSAPSPFAATPLAKAHTPAQLLSQAKLLQSIAKIVEKQTVRMNQEEAKMRAKKWT